MARRWEGEGALTAGGGGEAEAEAEGIVVEGALVLDLQARSGSDRRIKRR
jgi:hypothetical protein